MTHIEKLENAFVNYLTGLTVWTDGLLVLAGENNVDKDASRIVAYVEGGELEDEDPPLSGNRPASVVVELRTPFTKLTAKEIAAGTTQPLLQHQANAAALQTAISSATLDDQLTAAIAGFTVLGIHNRSEIYGQEENYWMGGWRVRLLSCPKSFAN